MWRPGEEKTSSWVEASSLSLPDPGTAVDVMATQTGYETVYAECSVLTSSFRRWLVAIGMENGHVVILEQDPSSLNLTQVMLLDSKYVSILIKNALKQLIGNRQH